MKEYLSLTDKSVVWKKIFLTLAFLSLILMPILSLFHGMAADEWYYIIYGHDIYDYFFKGSTIAADYSQQEWQQINDLHQHSALYHFITTTGHEVFFKSFDELSFRHSINALMGALLLIYTGLLAKLWGGWRSAVLTLLFMALSPRILGASMNNPIDIPFAASMVCFLYYLVQYIHSIGRQQQQWKYTLLMGLAFGICLGVRFTGIYLFPLALILIALSTFSSAPSKQRSREQLLGLLPSIMAQIILMGCIGYLICILFWPYALQGIFSKPFASLNALAHSASSNRMLYNGKYIVNTEAPITYNIKWLLITSPLLVLCSFVFSIACITPMYKRYGLICLSLLYTCALFPIIYAPLKHYTVYDTWHQFYFIYPYWVILGALLCNYLLERFSSNKLIITSLFSLIGVGMALPLVWTIQSFPNEYNYFNETVGGIQKAKGIYDLDDAQNAGKQAADWIRENARTINGKVLVGSNMMQVNHYFAEDTTHFAGYYVRYNDRDTKDWDYYISTVRNVSLAQLQDDTWPPKNAVHIIAVKGVALCAVLERKTKLDMEGNKAMMRQQLDSAFTLYQNALKIDASNDAVLVRYAALCAQRGLIEIALNNLAMAIQIDRDNPAIYNLQMQIYRAIGAEEKAQQAEKTLKNIMQ